MNDQIAETHHCSVRALVLNDLLTNGFVVKDNVSGALAMIDPGDRADDLVAAAREWGGDVRWILVTHLHGDHCAEVGAVKSAFPEAVVAGPPGGMFDVDRPVSGGETLEFGAHAILVCHTPGHSPESLGFQICEHFFVGDFLFRLGGGRTDGARASTEDLFRTIREVFAGMPGETILWCGHGPPSKLDEELEGNPFWRIALEGEPVAPLDKVQYQGVGVPVLAWADDYDGGRKALLRLSDDRLVIVPGSQTARFAES